MPSIGKPISGGGCLHQKLLTGLRFFLELVGLASHKGTGFGNAEQEDGRKLMPTLFRFVVILAILAGIAYGTMFALVMFVEPKRAEMSVRIPPEKLNPKKN
ncbi:mlr3574 [Mesorhizobium japonicum MAFF 303099]|uniref:Mlr3574 protein n=5 Tax=Mesorhizobium TaxID=68287 RepID=Q98FX9_RHILO|nr:mlr3574 [Mesorhizobium japonicum MAFF 303099]